MTITYQFNVATASFCGFAKLLFKWRGSVYKLLYKELLVYAGAFAVVSLIYRNVLDESQKLTFEQLSLYCSRYIDLIPLSFVMGFYVAFVVQRWWTQFTTIPWPDKLMNTIILYVNGVDERGRMIRRTLMRYWNLCLVLLLMSISVAVKKRFPTLQHVVEAGFMTEDEHLIFNSIQSKINKFWFPMNWFLKVLDQARIEGRVREGAAMKHILEEMNEFRYKLMLLWCHDWVTVPLVYTQVVTWATHLFFMVCLIGRQYLDPAKKYPGHELDMYVPFFTLLQFLFYMGWLKVAEQLINPFGEDDDDFECNLLIDRHLQASYLGVDELYSRVPHLEKDLHWDMQDPDLPYTAAALIHKIPTYRGSTMHLKMDKSDILPYKENMPKPKKNFRVHFWRRLYKTKSNLNLKTASMFGNGLKQRFDRDTPSPKTLGKRETLMADELLAMLNGGQKTFFIKTNCESGENTNTEQFMCSPFDLDENETPQMYLSDVVDISQNHHHLEMVDSESNLSELLSASC